MVLQFSSEDEAREFFTGDRDVEPQEEVEEPPKPVRHRPIPVTHLMALTLDTIADWDEPIKAEQLGELLGIPQKNASQRLVDYQEQGLVERIPSTWTWRLTLRARRRGWKAVARRRRRAA